MSKKEQRENLGVFIGLKAAHEILIKFTSKSESMHHLRQEADTYGDLGAELADGNWNNEDIEEIKSYSKKRCIKKLETYKDISKESYDEVDKRIENIMTDFGLLNNK